MKIFIIDDDERCAMGMASAIEPSGHHCRIFTSAAEGLRLYEQERPDLVITDVRMPGMDGLTLLKRLLELDGNARIVVNTAYGNMKTVVTAINAGACAFFLKPIELREMMKIVDRTQDELEAERLLQLRNKELLEETARLAQKIEELSAKR